MRGHVRALERAAPRGSPAAARLDCGRWSLDRPPWRQDRRALQSCEELLRAAEDDHRWCYGLQSTSLRQTLPASCRSSSPASRRTASSPRAGWGTATCCRRFASMAASATRMTMRVPLSRSAPGDAGVRSWLSEGWPPLCQACVCQGFKPRGRCPTATRAWSSWHSRRCSWSMILILSAGVSERCSLCQLAFACQRRLASSLIADSVSQDRQEAPRRVARHPAGEQRARPLSPCERRGCASSRRGTSG